MSITPSSYQRPVNVKCIWIIFIADWSLSGDGQKWPIEVTDNYSPIGKPAPYCAKVPIVVNGNILHSGDSIEVVPGITTITPVVNPKRWAYGYEETTNVISDTTYTITLEVVD